MATDQPDLASSSSQMILDWIKVTIKVNQQCKYGNIFLKYEKFYRFSSMRNFTGSILPTARKKLKRMHKKTPLQMSHGIGGLRNYIDTLLKLIGGTCHRDLLNFSLCL